MAISLGKEKRALAMIQNGHNLEEIKKEYWLIEKYTINYDDITIEKERFRYSAKQIMEKYKIPNIAWLIFLLNRAGKYEGECLFCAEDIYIHDSRTSQNMRSCNCKGKCDQCNQAYEAGSFNLCTTCKYKNQQKENKQKSYEKCYEELILDCFEWQLINDALAFFIYSTRINFSDEMKELHKKIHTYVQSFT